MTKKPEQRQSTQSGILSEIKPKPITALQQPMLKLQDKVALITGGNSGIGKAVALLFASEGAAVAITFTTKEKEDVELTKEALLEYTDLVLMLQGDIRQVKFCQEIVAKTYDTFGRIDIVVNCAAGQYTQESLTTVSDDKIIETFETNIFAPMRVSRAALPYLKEHQGTIINSAPVTTYKGYPQGIDYTATKEAIIAFTRSLAQNVAQDKIRVNAVAYEPIWSPFIPSSFGAKKVESFKVRTLFGYPGEPAEVAPVYLLLASTDGNYLTGQTIYFNGGDFITL